MTYWVKESKEELAKIYAIDTIISIAKQYLESNTISNNAVVLLLNCCDSDDDSKGPATTEKCIDFAINVMKQHKDNEHILERVCMFLYNVANIPEKKKKL